MSKILRVFATLLAAAMATQAYGQAANVTAFGADPTGVSDSTIAFTNASSSKNEVFAPCGTYLINWAVTSKNNFVFSGSGSCTYLKPFIPGKDVIKIGGGNFSIFRDFSVFDRGNAPNGNGITVSSGQGNTKFVNIIASGFRDSGIKVTGVDDNQLSGIDITGGVFLKNNIGISYTYSNDFRIINNTIGDNSSYGIFQINSNAGQVIGNFIWNNGIGISASASHFGWWSENRLTQSKAQGFSCVMCYYITVTNNQSYQNSSEVPGAAEDWRFVNANGLIFTGNNTFDWTGIPHTNYGLTIDETSRNVTVQNNQFSFNKISSAFISPKAINVQYRYNLTSTDASINNCLSGFSLAGSSSLRTVGGRGSTIYLGSSQGKKDAQVLFAIAAPSNVCAFSVFVDSPPGTGQSYTFTLRKNGVSTGIAGKIVGTKTSAANIFSQPNAISVAQGDALDIMMVSSAGAAATTVRYSIVVSPR
jgi:hypothetical protein